MSNKERIREYLGEFGVKDHSSDKKAILSINSSQPANSTVDLAWPASTGTIAVSAAIPEGWEELTGPWSGADIVAFPATFLSEVRLFKFGPLRKMWILGTIIADPPNEHISASGYFVDHAPQNVVRRPIVSNAADLMIRIDTDGYLQFTDVGSATVLTGGHNLFFGQAYTEFMWSVNQ